MFSSCATCDLLLCVVLGVGARFLVVKEKVGLDLFIYVVVLCKRSYHY